MILVHLNHTILLKYKILGHSQKAMPKYCRTFFFNKNSFYNLHYKVNGIESLTVAIPPTLHIKNIYI